MFWILNAPNRRTVYRILCHRQSCSTGSNWHFYSLLRNRAWPEEAPPYRTQQRKLNRRSGTWMFSSVKSFGFGGHGSLFSTFRISPLIIFVAWNTWYAALQLSAFEYTDGYSSSVMFCEADTPASIICPVGTSFAYTISVSLLHDGRQHPNLFSKIFMSFFFTFSVGRLFHCFSNTLHTDLLHLSFSKHQDLVQLFSGQK